MLNLRYQEAMRKNHLFMDIDQQDFDKIVEGSSVSKLNSGEILFSQQQAATEFFLLVAGKIQISLLSMEGAEKVVDIIKPGSTFAEAIIFQGMKGYPVNSKALSDAIVIRINAENYTRVLSNSPDACFKVMGRLSVRLHWLVNEMERVSLHSASYRLISYLIENLDNDLDQNTNIEVILSAPKHVIASRLSITPETFSRTLKALSKKGLLTVHDNHIILNNIEELREMISI